MAGQREQHTARPKSGTHGKQKQDKTMTDETVKEPINAHKVAETERMKVMPALFGMRFAQVEQTVYYSATIILSGRRQLRWPVELVDSGVFLQGETDAWIPHQYSTIQALYETPRSRAHASERRR
ncbi:MAG: hypothetical protein BWK73_15460 [Thiothrix lacustris]|uniref:Uncharacterized protein n=1 Tax=Thiothrix lacustris TaxID=525917 RepID=A0A1Y1QRN1_9GAMM|nr:MAG: hypothetical protein BWK73_15460 [Thiothrix lacustris]